MLNKVHKKAQEILNIEKRTLRQRKKKTHNPMAKKCSKPKKPSGINDRIFSLSIIAAMKEVFGSECGFERKFRSACIFFTVKD
jgi:hypothetical protein